VKPPKTKQHKLVQTRSQENGALQNAKNAKTTNLENARRTFGAKMYCETEAAVACTA